MKKVMEKLEDVFAAAAFAEAGEHETAKEMMKKQPRDQKRDVVDARPRKQMRAPGIKR
ncbi:hypothetical protein H8E50_10700 [bacterium]|nr:hypothetical protein [bacterium]